MGTRVLSLLGVPVVVAWSACSPAAESPPPACLEDLPASCPVQIPSYRADVAPIVSNHCLKCHSPDGQAKDRILTDYVHVYSLRGAVLNQAYACRMPPAGEEPLSSADRATLFGWLVCKAPDN